MNQKNNASANKDIILIMVNVCNVMKIKIVYNVNMKINNKYAFNVSKTNIQINTINASNAEQNFVNYAVKKEAVKVAKKKIIYGVIIV